jgi:hypothetical protein
VTATAYRRWVGAVTVTSWAVPTAFDLDALRAYRHAEIMGNAFRRPAAYRCLTGAPIAGIFVLVGRYGRPPGVEPGAQAQDAGAASGAAGLAVPLKWKFIRLSLPDRLFAVSGELRKDPSRTPALGSSLPSPRRWRKSQ